MIPRPSGGTALDLSPSEELETLIDELDRFIERDIRPLEEEHPKFFDHRREHARTNWEDGTPSREWEKLLSRQRKLAEEAGFYRYILPEEWGGRDGSNFDMAVIREHLARKGPGLHNVLQQEASVVGNFTTAEIIRVYGSDEQIDRHLQDMYAGRSGAAFGLTEPGHGSDVTHMDTVARRDGDDWVIDGEKRFISGMHRADHCLIFARTSGEDGDHGGFTCFLVPSDAEGFEVDFFWWTFNMPTDHAEITLDGVRVPEAAVVGEVGAGLRPAQHFYHEGRIRQAAASVGAAQFCVDQTVDYARQRKTWGDPLAERQGIQFPVTDLHAEAEMIRNTVLKTARLLDDEEQLEVSDQVSMVNYRANQLVCLAADRAIQIHGGLGYTRHKPFEHIYRHHRRYRITEGSEEIQKRRAAGHLFGFIGGG